MPLPFPNAAIANLNKAPKKAPKFVRLQANASNQWQSTKAKN
jgi:hypothetical protein